MGGKHGLRGYLIQTIITVIDSLEENNKWVTVCLEPDDESEKVDIKWIYESGQKKVVQVKSSENTISLKDAQDWCTELKTNAQDAEEYELVLVGRSAERLHKLKDIDGVSITEKPLDFDALSAIALERIDVFFATKGKQKISAPIRKILFSCLTQRFNEGSIFSKEINRTDFNVLLLDWLVSIEKQATDHPFSQFIPFEESINSSNLGHEIVRNILKLIGWNKFNENETVEEVDETTGECLTYSVDFYGDYESKLKDEGREHIFINTLLNNEYPLSTKEEIKNYVQSTQKVSDNLRRQGKIGQSNSLLSVLFWLSMSNDEINNDFIFSVKDNYKPNILDSEFNYYLVDNVKANFIISSIITAKNYRETLPVKFLYPITEENSSPKKIGKRGFQLPPQYINSSIIPIIKENSDKISVLLFCSDNYSEDTLKKIIWLIVRLTSGFGNEYIVYFPDFESKYQNEANNVIRSFNDEILNDKLKVSKYATVSISELKNIPQIESTKEQKVEYDESKDIEIKINESFKEQLPYGDILKPFLNTDSITAQDLKIFLGRKGIFVRNSDRKKIIQLMTTLLFSPSELINFVSFINTKDRPCNIVPTFFPLVVQETKVQEIFKKITPNFDSISDGLSSKLLDPVVFKQDKANPELYVFKSYVETKDPTKQIAVNTTWAPITVTFRKEGDKILNSIETNSREGKAIAKRITDRVKIELVEKNIIRDDSIKLMFDSFIDNQERVNFLLGFTNISESILFIDQDIKSIKYIFDETKEIPKEYLDRTEKDLIIFLKGKKLAGLNEISNIEFKKIILLEEININYKFNWRGVIGYFSVKYNFSDAFNSKPRFTGEFRSEPFLHSSYLIKRNVQNISTLETELKREIEKIKIERMRKYNKL